VKGISQYIMILLVTVFVLMFSFYLLAELLSKEEEVSTISRAFSSAINKIEYSKVYFMKMMENEYSVLSKSLSKEEIAKRVSKKYNVTIDNIISTFEVRNVSVNMDEIELYITQSSKYFDSVFQIEANKSFVMRLR